MAKLALTIPQQFQLYASMRSKGLTTQQVDEAAHVKGGTMQKVLNGAAVELDTLDKLLDILAPKEDI